MALKSSFSPECRRLFIRYSGKLESFQGLHLKERLECQNRSGMGKLTRDMGVYEGGLVRSMAYVQPQARYDPAQNMYGAEQL
jgi:hypothetical protein